MSSKSIFKETEIGKIPEDWKVKRLIDISTEITDGSHFSPKEDPLGKYKMASVKDFSEYGFDTNACKKISEEEYANLIKSGCIPEQGDILLSKDGTMGIVYVSRGENIALLSSIAIIKPGREIYSGYLAYFLKDKRTQHDLIDGHSSGSALPRIVLKDMKELLVAIPKEYQEQKSIAKILSDLDAKIELNQQMNKTLESMGKVIFKHWFIDFEFPDADNQPYKSSGGAMIDSSNSGVIPKGWSEKQIKDLGYVVCGKTPPTTDKENYGDEFPFITIPDMHNQIFIVKTEEKLSKKGADTQAKKELPPFSICVSCIATPGIVVLTSESSYTNQQINSIICNEKTSHFFVYYALKNKSEYVKTLGSGGTATLNLNKGSFERITVIVPPEDLVEKYHNIVNPFFREILNNSKQNISLSEIRDSLLPKLMSGKIRIPVTNMG